jgi:arylsulfatase A-like enzyme
VELASGDDVENVLIYISDSLRYDYVPDSISSLGVSARAISPSTFTASSVPSILGGNYPHEHRVWGFSEQLSQPPWLLRTANSGGANVERVWGDEYELDEKPTLSLLNLDRHTPYDELGRPFTYVVHDHGGHSPYGEAGERFKPSRTFFEANQNDERLIEQKYVEGVRQSVERFQRLLDELERDGELSRTLCIFTSDHGELLGEHGGIYEHTSPMVPELLEVPVVFCGAGIPGGMSFDRLLSGLDIAPTALSAQGRSVPDSMTGWDLWTGATHSRQIRADIWRRSSYGERVCYAASSVWDENGGLVVHRGPRAGRLAFALGANLYMAPYAPVVRKRPLKNTKALLSAYLPRTVRYGRYGGSVTPADLTEPAFEPNQGASRVEVDSEKLRALGYVE